MSKGRDVDEGYRLYRAWRYWITSNRLGRECKEGTASGEYLENRLWQAFMAGASAERDISHERALELAGEEES